MITIFKLIALIIVLLISVYFFDAKSTAHFAEQTFLFKLVVVFLSGIFYTSFLTLPLSIILLVAMASHLDPYVLAVIGGMGAIIGDLVIIKIFRTIFSFFSFVRHQDNFKRLKKTLRFYHLDLVAIILGSIIIASPLPDELGLILLGASKLSYFRLAILAFFLNSFGILIITLAVRAIR